MKAGYCKHILLILSLLLLSYAGYGQGMLARPVSVNIKKQPLKEVLKTIGQQGGFYFSYNSNDINADSLVSLKATGKTVKQVLDMLFTGTCQYKEIDNHVVIQKPSKDKVYTVEGYISDRASGDKLGEVSVFERNQLVSSLTGTQGYFRLKLKDKDKRAAAVITISKAFYVDTTITIEPGYDQRLDVVLTPKIYSLPNVDISQYSQMERSWFGKFFLSSRQRVQSVNLNKFFVDKPYQLSFTPGLGTHGKMSAQVVNRFSFNILGGYTAGIHGCEIAGVFNITKKEAQYVQIAGVFNLVGGGVKGVQASGIVNVIEDSVRGVQIAGVTSIVNGSVNGIQATGVYNHAAKGMKGIQIGGVGNYSGQNAKGIQTAGVANVVNDSMYGLQIAGIANIVRSRVRGMQLSGINYTRRLDGVQMGLINIADTSTGYSIGFINFIRNGYYKMAVYATEMQDVNVDYKSGNRKLYSILSVGANTGTAKSYSLGYGMGKVFAFSPRISLTTEALVQSYYLGTWAALPVQVSVKPCINVRIVRKINLFAGPSFCARYTSATTSIQGYHADALANNIVIADRVAGWIGWSGGISFF